MHNAYSKSKVNALDQSHGATPNIKVNSKFVFQENVQWQLLPE